MLGDTGQRKGITVSDYAQLSARTNHQQLEESDIFLTLQDPQPDPLTIDWRIRFPFPVVPANKTSGTIRLDPYHKEVISWITDLARLPVSRRQAASDQEIVVELRLSSAGNAFQDGTRSTLKQLL
jgi:hypothetical protein